MPPPAESEVLKPGSKGETVSTPTRGPKLGREAEGEYKKHPTETSYEQGNGPGTAFPASPVQAPGAAERELGSGRGRQLLGRVQGASGSADQAGCWGGMLAEGGGEGGGEQNSSLLSWWGAGVPKALGPAGGARAPQRQGEAPGERQRGL